MSRPGNDSSRCLNIGGSIDMTSSKCPWMGQSLTIRTLPSRSMMVALISPTFSLSRTDTSWLPSMIAWRASRVQVGHSESVCRGQPSGGLVFWNDLFSGLSDHLGVKEGFWRIEFRVLNTCHTPLAVTAMPFSTYLMGRCIACISPAQTTTNLSASIDCSDLKGQDPKFRPTGRSRSRVASTAGERSKATLAVLFSVEGEAESAEDPPPSLDTGRRSGSLALWRVRIGTTRGLFARHLRIRSKRGVLDLTVQLGANHDREAEKIEPEEQDDESADGAIA